MYSYKDHYAYVYDYNSPINAEDEKGVVKEQGTINQASMISYKQIIKLKISTESFFEPKDQNAKNGTRVKIM